MFREAHSAIQLIAAAAAFGLVISIWLAGVVLWTAKKRKRMDQMQERLKLAESAPNDGPGRVLRLWHNGTEATTTVPGMISGSFFDRFERMRIEANFHSPMSIILIRLAAAMLIAAMIGYVTANSPVIVIAAPVAVLIVFWIYLNQRIAKSAAIFERQLIDALELASRSLRVGHPLVGAFRLIAEELPAPMGEMFGRICQQQELGVSMEDAMQNIARDSVSEDMALFATSVVIQIRSGGNLADMMQRLAAVIRERQRLARRVRVLTAQTQFSKRVLLSMPFMVFVLLNVINPRYMQPLYTTGAGEIIAIVSAFILLLGWIMMNWLSKLTV